MSINFQSDRGKTTFYYRNSEQIRSASHMSQQAITSYGNICLLIGKRYFLYDKQWDCDYVALLMAHAHNKPKPIPYFNGIGNLLWQITQTFIIRNKINFCNYVARRSINWLEFLAFDVHYFSPPESFIKIGFSIKSWLGTDKIFQIVHVHSVFGRISIKSL